MLMASAKDPAMLTFLDNATSDANSAAGINENYGREILELHSLGIVNGQQVYTEEDMRQVSLVLSGWSVDWQQDRDAFKFRPLWHHRGPVSILGGAWSRPDRTGASDAQLLADGENLVSFLAHHPSTARHLAFKMCRRFVADEPPMGLVDRMASIYLANGTAIAPMLRELFTSPEFAENTDTKLRRGFEVVMGISAGTQRKYRHQPGWRHRDRAAFAQVWLGSDGVLRRWETAGLLTHNQLASGITVSLDELVPNPLPATMGDLIDAMMVSRRKLLGTGAAAIGATAAFTALGSAIADGTPSNPADNDVLVVVFLRGGADGLSILPPVAYPSYYDLRRKQGYDIAVSQEQAIGIGHNTFALHPAMAPLVEAYNANNLAFIPAVAAPAALTASRSHFEVQDVMERAGTNVMASDGWLARHVRTSGTEDIPALSMDKRTHVSLSGANVGTVSFPTAQNFQLYGYSDPTSAAAALARIYPYGTGDALVDEGANTLAAVRRVGGINFAGIPPQVTYPNEPFAKQLRELAQLIRAGIGLRVATLSSEGWDSHSDMGGAEPGGSMYDRIRNLAEGLASFRADLGNQGSEVTTVIMSEFGRAIEVNGSGGTDHGRGGLMMVLGQSVNGGIYGPFPNAIENGPEGDIEVLTDFRQVLSEVVAKRLGNAGNLGHIFPGYSSPGHLGVAK
ncbi:hypothetical protein GQR58_030039 [Nymphon striatum]|nr:hypothetical protein GQR58_030039 [Nymphon striatum]